MYGVLTGTGKDKDQGGFGVRPTIMTSMLLWRPKISKGKQGRIGKKQKKKTKRASSIHTYCLSVMEKSFTITVMGVDVATVQCYSCTVYDILLLFFLVSYCPVFEILRIFMLDSFNCTCRAACIVHTYSVTLLPHCRQAIHRKSGVNANDNNIKHQLSIPSNASLTQPMHWILPLSKSWAGFAVVKRFLLRTRSLYGPLSCGVPLGLSLWYLSSAYVHDEFPAQSLCHETATIIYCNHCCHGVADMSGASKDEPSSQRCVASIVWLGAISSRAPVSSSSLSFLFFYFILLQLLFRKKEVMSNILYPEKQPPKKTPHPTSHCSTASPTVPLTTRWPRKSYINVSCKSCTRMVTLRRPRAFRLSSYP